MTHGEPGKPPSPTRRRRTRCGPLMIAAAAIMLASCTSDGAGTSPASTTSPPSTTSPLKGRIAFDRMTGADYESSYLGTFIANADGTGEQPLPIPNGWSGPVSPVWAPDGSRLVVNLWREPGGPGR